LARPRRREEDEVKNVVRRQLLERLDRAWVAFKASYAGLSEKELREPGVTGQWSIRDIIAHVTTWDEEALQHLPTILDGGKPPRYSLTYGGIDRFNALMTTKNMELSLFEVLRQLDDSHRRIIELIERVPAEQLTGDARFRRRLRLDTYGHYPKHAAAIRRWRERHVEGNRRAP
jgi:hypothetical protein